MIDKKKRTGLAAVSLGLQYCIKDKEKTTGKERESSPRIKVRTVHTLNHTLNYQARTNGHKLTLTQLYTKFTSIIKISLVEKAKSAAFYDKIGYT